MAEVNLSLKFAVAGSENIEKTITSLENLQKNTKFKIELDIKDFNDNLKTLKENLGKLGMNKTFQSSIEALKKTFEGFNTDKLDSGKIKAFIGDLTAVNTADIKEIVKQLNSLAPALAQLNSAKVPNLNSFMNGLKKLEAGNFNVDKIKDVINTINSFQAINLQILGTKDLQTLLRVLKQFGESGIDDTVIKKLNKIAKALNNLKLDIKMTGLNDLNDFIKRLRAIDKLQLDEQKFLKKMETIKKGFEQLSQAKIDINKIKSMADLMRELNGAGGGGGSGGSSGFGGMGGILGGFLSISAVNTQIEAAKDLEYAILQVGVAGELSSNQMAEVKNKMFDFSRDSGKSALEITQAMDAIIKTGQSLSDSSLILETSVKTAVAAGKVFALYDSNIISKVA
jgi:hypothetical protein